MKGGLEVSDQREYKARNEKTEGSEIDKEKRKEGNNLFARRSFKETPIK